MGKWANFLFLKKKPVVAVEKSRTEIDVGLGRISQDLALSELHLDKLYRPLLIRVKELLNVVGEQDKFTMIIDVLAEMLRFRRGVTLPENIEAEQIQRYREISSYTLVLAVLSKLIAEYHSKYSIQFDAQGEIRNYTPIFSHVMKSEVKKVGVTRSSNDVIGHGVEEGMAILQVADFLKVVPNAVVWYASFPDMMKILFALCLGKRTGQFNEVVEKYSHLAINACFGDINQSGNNPSLSPESKPSPKVGSLFMGQVNESSVATNTTQTNALQQSLTGTASPTQTVETKQEATTKSSTVNPALAALLSNIKTPQVSHTEEAKKDVIEGNKSISESDLQRFLTMVVEQHHELSTWVAKESGEVVVAIPARIYRQICSSLHRHLSDQERINTELEFIESLKPYQRGPEARGTIGPQVTDSGEKMMLITKDFYDSANGPEILKNIP
ncbi:hypothetical protein L1D35_19880 [Vibrio harveyi]|uniref:hypothetical protein n=1 Tax=Vibrio harveyi TaxID=669 RepID=UPI001EFEAC12|nr:hypothetical protein [Vibrio harveyi]MCG9589874.1 hypothetical protein [Vibrio harveyi]MCG9670270.1 hypothetical protein [Vibrio harveyi]